MELLCVFAALAAVFLFSAFLTLKCGLHSALAPLTALAVAVFWLTVWGMAGPLLAGAWLLYAAFAGLGGVRLYPRVLPTHEALDACAAAGIPARNIIAMQGPFTQALNEALLHQYGARWFVTKDGGAPGGFAEKAAAAHAAGAQLVVIRRPEVKVDGVSYEQALEACRKAVQRCRTDPGSP